MAILPIQRSFFYNLAGYAFKWLFFCIFICCDFVVFFCCLLAVNERGGSVYYGENSHFSVALPIWSQKTLPLGKKKQAIKFILHIDSLGENSVFLLILSGVST